MSLRAFGLTGCLVVAAIVVACSTNGGGPSDAGASVFDDDAGDASIGPLVCGLPVASTCPSNAPCTFAAWGCPGQTACDGYLVVTDGAWEYFYSSYGGALAGEAPVGDAGVEACPYAFEAPGGCKAVASTLCTGDAGAIEDAGPDVDAASDGGADATLDGGAVDGGDEGGPDGAAD